MDMKWRLQNSLTIFRRDKYAGLKAKKPDKMCNLHNAFARPLKVLATLGNRLFAGLDEVKFLIR